MEWDANRIKAIFAQALEKKLTAERESFLAEVCKDQPELRQEVESLLRAHEHAGDFLEQTAPMPAPEFVMESIGTRIGRYKLLERIGEGGFGVVYMAEQQEPVTRKVALKVIKAGMDTREVIARFEAERQALALMDHPNIARVFDGGATEAGRPYFVMELVRGMAITRYCDEHRLSVEERLVMFIQVCQAVQHAHQKGIIHRDLKPSNVLVSAQDDRPVPKVIDFGVAKATAQRLTEKTLFTRFHQFIGTPAYMSPEQTGTNREDIDTRSDIYSLGVLLYELLTGTTPFDTKKLLEAGYEAILKAIREQQPPRLSARLSTLTKDELGAVAKERRTMPEKLGKTVRGELDWIVMKALEKERTRRYGTVSDLCDDLRRFLSDEPVKAAPPSVTYRTRRFVARNRVALGFTTSVVVCLMLGALVSLSQARRANREAKEAALQRSVATNEAARTAAALKESERHRHRAEEGERETHRLLYIANMNLIQREWDQNNIGRLHKLLEETRDFPEKDFEWFWWQRQIHRDLQTLCGHLGGVRSVAFSPDGKRVASYNGDGTASIWEVSTGRELLTLGEHNGVEGSVAFSPDGNRIVTGSRGHGGSDTQTQVWDAKTGQELLTLKGHTATVVCARFSRDGKRILTGSLDQTAKLWDATSGRELLTLGGYTNAGVGVLAAFSLDNLRIVTSCGHQPVKVWDAATGRELFALAGKARESADFDYIPVAFSPDGKWIATSMDKVAMLYDAASGAEVLSLNGHTAQISSVAFSPDGRWIATASVDQTARTWEAASGRELLTFKGHTSEVWRLAFSPDGQRIATGSLDQTVKIWDVSASLGSVALEGHRDWVQSVACSPNSKWVVTGSRDHTARVWDSLSGRESLIFEGHTNMVNCVAFSPDGGRIASGSHDGLAKVWETFTGRELLNLSSRRGEIDSLAFSPDGSRLAAVVDGGAKLMVWHALSGKELLRLNLHVWGAGSVTFSPNGQRILTGSWDGLVKIWDATNGQELVTLKGHTAPVNSVAFSPDGQWFVSGSFDRTAKVWKAATGQEVLSLKGHAAEVLCVAVSPSGRRIATGSLDQTVKLWDAVTGRELLTLRGHTGQIWSLAFSPDGRQLITGSGDRTARVWEAATPEQVSLWADAEQVARQRLDDIARRLRLENEQRRTNQPPRTN
jgi:WD40 repeat protein/serine/threonine protein kinase